MCRVLEVSRTGFYASQSRALSDHSRVDQALAVQIEAIHKGSKYRYGSPRIHRALRSRGVKVARKRVARLMIEGNLRAKKKKRFCITTNSAHGHAIAPNLLDREFSVAGRGPDEVWVADITYVPTREGWLYLSVVIDLASRLVVGWGMGARNDHRLCLRALQMAVMRRQPGTGLIHHSDQGVQYASEEYRQALAAHGMAASMSRRGNCWDNAVAESFFATLEWELIEQEDWHTRQEAMAALFHYIEVWYNRNRLHSSLDYMTPDQYDAQLSLNPRAA
jgi:putative transposase